MSARSATASTLSDAPSQSAGEPETVPGDELGTGGPSYSLASRLFHFVSAAWDGVQRFPDESLEEEFVEFSQLPNLWALGIGCVCAAVVMVVPLGWMTTFWDARVETNYVPLAIHFAAGALYAMSGIVMIGLAAKGRCAKGRYTEKALLWTHGIVLVTLCVTVNWTIALCSYETDNFRVFKDATACFADYVPLRPVMMYGGFAFKRPRFMPYTVTLLLLGIVALPIARYAFNPRAPYYAWLPLHLCSTAMLAIVFGGTEAASRRRFIDYKESRKAMETADAAKQNLNHLMLTMVHDSVLNRLVTGQLVADVVDASVVFSDIAGFTTWSSSQKPLRVITMLSSMYHLFDQYLEPCSIMKITTIGDAYWAASGIPVVSPEHARNAVRFALFISKHARILQESFKFRGVRVGVATGLVCGAVVGSGEVAYQLYGDVNHEAERMEQLAPVNGVLISAACASSIRDTDIFLRASAQHDGAFEATASPAMEDPVVQHAVTSPLASTQRSGTFGSARSSVLSHGGVAPLTPAMIARQELLRVKVAPSVDFALERETLGQQSGITRCLAFASADVEKSYADFRIAAYARPARLQAGAFVVWAVVSFFFGVSYLAVSSRPHDVAWCAAVAVVSAVLGVFSSSLASSIGETAPVILHVVHLLIVPLPYYALIMTGPDAYAYSAESRLLGITVCYCFSMTRFPYGPWFSGIVVVAFSYFLQFVVLIVTRNTVLFSFVMTGLMIVAALFILSTFINDRELRSQFLDRFIADQAREAIAEEHDAMAALLGRAMPQFVVPQLNTWLLRGRSGRLCHSFGKVAVMFLKVDTTAAASKMVAEGAFRRSVNSPGRKASHRKSSVMLETSGEEGIVATDPPERDASPPSSPPGSKRRKSLAGGLAFSNSQGSFDPSNDLAQSFFKSVERMTQVFDHVARLVEKEDGCVTKIKSVGDVLLLVSGMSLQACAEDASTSDGIAPSLTNVARLVRIAWSIHADHPLLGFVAGIHDGPVAGGVIGDDRLIYDIFGDTVNTASRVMSTSADSPGVYVSDSSLQHAVSQGQVPTAGNHGLAPFSEMPSPFTTSDSDLSLPLSFDVSLTTSTGLERSCSIAPPRQDAQPPERSYCETTAQMCTLVLGPAQERDAKGKGKLLVRPVQHFVEDLSNATPGM